MLEKHTDLYGGFNLESIKRAQAKGITSIDELSA